MSQTFYIESDEEIISVIGKLRKSSTELNYFVIPKRALILQSIVNLRLFQREAQKLGKKIILVTQDEVGQNLAKKVGMQTENYSDDFSKKNGHLELTATSLETPKNAEPTSSPLPLAQAKRPMPRSDSIGSAEFNQFGAESVKSAQQSSPQTQARDLRLRVRNSTSAGLTALNSLRSAGPPENLPPFPLSSAPAVRGSRQKNESLRTEASRAEALRDGSERLKKFFSSAAPIDPSRPASPGPPEREAAVSQIRPDKKNARYIILALGGLSLVTLSTVGAYLFFPKAEISVTPYKTSRFVNLEFEGSTGASVSGATSLPVRILEKEQAVSLTVEATGTSTNSNQKARGNIVIYNTFSADAQILVATTRFEAPDGKIFRLVQGVTVPGMKNTEPGSIEAAVIADQSGTEYNIAPSTFSIPGFKGGAKFNKFSGRSTQAMVGGGDGGSEMKVIAEADIERAKKEAEDQARHEFLSRAAEETSGGEKILESALEVTALGSQSPPPAETFASSFEFENSYRIRAFVIPEGVIRDKIMKENGVTIENISFIPESIALTYDDSTPRFSEGKIDLKVRALLNLRSDIREDELRDRLLGQSEEGIAEVLPDFPEVKNIEVRFNPRGLVSTIPNRKERVTIVERPAEEAGEQ